MSAPIQPLLRGGMRLAAVLLLVAGLFLLGILLSPSPAPVQALNPPVPILTPSVPPTTGMKGTVASFSALMIQVPTINLPLIMR